MLKSLQYLQESTYGKVAIGGALGASVLLLASRRIGKGINVIWDLDDTLIKSVHLTTYTDKKNMIVEMNKSHVFEHIDDDMMHFRTYIRPYTRMTLFFFKWIGIKQYIFTSATVGYMNNISTFLDPNNNIFEKSRFSTSDFQQRFLSRNGKNIKYLCNNYTTNDKPIGHETKYITYLDMSRSILIDDKIKYHLPQPENGILCKTFDESEDEGLKKLSIFNDKELLKIVGIVVKCCFSKDVRNVLDEYQTQEYKQKIDARRSKN